MTGLEKLFIGAITRVVTSAVGKKVSAFLSTQPDARAAATLSGAHSEFPALEGQLRAWVSDASFTPVRDHILNGAPPDVDEEALDSFRKGTQFFQLGVSVEDERALVLEFLNACREAHLQEPGGIAVLLRQGDYAARRNDETARLVSEMHRDVKALGHAPALVAVDSGFDTKEREHLVFDTRIQGARSLLHKGSITAARESLTALEHEIDGKDVPIRLRFRIATNLGACALGDDDTKEVRRQFERALAFCPDDTKAIANRALCALLERDLGRAVELASRALAAEPRSGHAMGILLQALYHSGDIGRLEELEASEAWMRDDLGCSAALGWIRHAQGRHVEAEKLLRTAVAGEPFNTALRTALVGSIVEPIEAEVVNIPLATWRMPEERKARLAEAEELQSGTINYLEARGHPEQLFEALLLRSHIRSLGGRWKEAVVDCDRVLLEVPEHPGALALRGLLSVNHEPAEAAIDYLQRAARAGAPDCTLPLATAYVEAGKPSRAVELLEPLLADATTDPRVAVRAAEALLHAWRELGDAAGRDRTLAFLAARGADGMAITVRAREAFHDSKPAECEELLRSAIAAAEPAFRDFVHLELGDFLSQVNRYGEAADSYREVVGVPGDTPGTRRLVVALFRAGKYRDAAELAAQARGKGPPLVPTTEVEATLLDLKGDLTGARALWASLAERFPKQPNYLVQTALLDIRSGKDADARATLDRLSIDDLGMNAEALVRVGHARYVLGMPDALEYNYQARRAGFDDPNVHMAYVGLFLSIEAHESRFEVPTSVQPGSVVRFTSRDGDHRVAILEKGVKPRLETERSPEDALIQVLLGHAVCDDVTLRESPYDPHRITVREIQNRYVAAFQESLMLFETRFPTFPLIESIDARDPNATVAKMLTAVDARQHSMKGVAAAYRAGHVSIGAFATLAGRSIFEAWSGLCADETLGVRAGGTGPDELAAAQGTSAVVCDAISLFTLQHLGLLGTLSENASRIYVPSAVREELAQALVQVSKGPKARGYLAKDGDRYVLVEEAETIHASAVAFHRAVIDFIDAHTEVVPAESLLDMEPQAVEGAKKILGSGFVSALIAHERKLPLFSDDFALRAFAASKLGIKGFWTNPWLSSLRTRGVLDTDRYREALVALMFANYRYPGATSEDFLWAIRREGYQPNAKVARVLSHLAGPECAVASAASMISYLILSIWLDPVLPTRRYAILDMLLDTLVRGRSRAAALHLLDRALVQRFVLLPIQHEEVSRAIKAWEKSRPDGAPSLKFV